MEFTAEHVIITDIDRRAPGESIAFDVAVQRIREGYAGLCKRHPIGTGTNFQITLVVEFEPEQESA